MNEYGQYDDIGSEEDYSEYAEHEADENMKRLEEGGKVADNMRKHGNDFEKRLGETIEHAKIPDMNRIQNAFPEL